MNEPQSSQAVQLSKVTFTWPGKNAFQMEIPDFSVAKGESVMLLGESGSGKSTLLSLICGVITPDNGSVNIDGTDLASLSSGARDRFRADNIGVIFQQFNLLSYATPLENVLLALQFAPERRRRITNARAETLSLTSALGLPDALVRQSHASGLSVGQQQRVAVARALIGSPSLIIADEPTSSLDAGAQVSFLDLLFEQVKAADSTLLMVSHDDRLGDRFDRLVDLKDIASAEREQAA